MTAFRVFEDKSPAIRGPTGSSVIFTLLKRDASQIRQSCSAHLNICDITRAAGIGFNECDAFSVRTFASGTDGESEPICQPSRRFKDFASAQINTLDPKVAPVIAAHSVGVTAFGVE